MINWSEIWHRIHALNESQWRTVLQQASIVDTTGGAWRSYDAKKDEAWFTRHSTSLLAVLPRFLDLGDDLALFADEIDTLCKPTPGTAKLTFRQLGESSQTHATNVGLHDLAASSVTFFQTYIDIARLSRFRLEPIPPPKVSIEKGSVQFSFGGPSLLISGLSLVIACSAGLVASPFALVGGLGLASLGLIDQVINWRKTLADTKATHETISKSQLERRKLELEIKEKEMALQSLSFGPPAELEGAKEQIIRALEELRRKPELQESHNDPPPSSMIPFEVVKQEAQANGLSVGLAHHILNRTLPNYLMLKPYFQDVKVAMPASQTSKTGSSPHAKRRSRQKR